MMSKDALNAMERFVQPSCDTKRAHFHKRESQAERLVPFTDSGSGVLNYLQRSPGFAHCHELVRAADNRLLVGAKIGHCQGLACEQLDECVGANREVVH